ncbi:hypothetical protein FK515_29435, partial [Klebsiella pneumoniae]|nr:hypothetical protein [Klebsiella pneumoniae]
SPSSLPLSQGKTTAAVALSKYYGAACLSIDAVVEEAISKRSSSAGLCAQELCIRAAIEQKSRKETERAGKEKRWTPSSASETHHDHPPPLLQRSSLTALGSLGEHGCSV